eukprot:3938159-Rhodomonas_salina.1
MGDRWEEGRDLVEGLERGPLDRVAHLLVLLGLGPQHVQRALLVLALLHHRDRKHALALRRELLRALLQKHSAAPRLSIQLVEAGTTGTIQVSTLAHCIDHVRQSSCIPLDDGSAWIIAVRH